MNEHGLTMEMVEAYRVANGVPHVQRDSATLMFADGAQHEFYIRGAIAWPRLVGANVSGCVIVAGLSTTNRSITILSEAEFSTVGTFFNRKEGRIEAVGLDDFLRKGRLHLFCETYFWRGQDAMARLMTREVWESEGKLGFRPHFVEVLWPDDEYARSRVALSVRERQVVERPFSQVVAEARQVADGGLAAGAGLSPRVEALATLLTGFGKFPWRGEYGDYF